MTNARDLQNGMVGDPVDNRVEFGTDYKGDMTYTYQKIWMYHGDLIADEDVDKWLYSLVTEINPVGISELISALIDENSSADVFDWLTSDNYITSDNLMESIGATLVNNEEDA
ncbi:MAG: hypothetical protein LKG79_07360 [Furfurilactobacillus sp.]|jgi:hypothetical protein|uniref:hypothetical protein n=1 Tax=Furfurilactobacillus sp. TaxID=2767911 RepID=UPI00258D3A3A|nr:hypothetical protein [Furfurilactobacillus sp.]MCH4010564.1 hypothetical protein [Furfurilactobacillus sp.]MCH4036456.1 hypothetical protein [Furfurilactobacillus sp.]MCH4114598.1 hypothetical protein [Furfurilactobacillus sp.]MCH4133783.1 hypothetical protein [Furfurilactobacillus sp.]MCI1340180.1 hypothetical protein [Furfurilactobacillus sp.]